MENTEQEINGYVDLIPESKFNFLDFVLLLRDKMLIAVLFIAGAVILEWYIVSVIIAAIFTVVFWMFHRSMKKAERKVNSLLSLKQDFKNAFGL